jgi:hypothetical protein
MSVAPDDVKLSSSLTVHRYKELEALGARGELARFIQERFEERYFRPAFDTPRDSKHGFALIALGCLVVETLEAFYQGLVNTKGKSRLLFQDFFERDTPLRVFASKSDWFFYDIRCGILHQAEARNGWRILRSGALCNPEGRTINAHRFLRELQAAVSGYGRALQSDDVCWAKFKVKMKAVCENCAYSEGVRRARSR